MEKSRKTDGNPRRLLPTLATILAAKKGGRHEDTSWSPDRFGCGPVGLRRRADGTGSEQANRSPRDAGCDGASCQPDADALECSSALPSVPEVPKRQSIVKDLAEESGNRPAEGVGHLSLRKVPRLRQDRDAGPGDSRSDSLCLANREQAILLTPDDERGHSNS